MRNKTFWQISLGFTGGTFVDWSINYLMGIKKHTVIGNNFVNHSDIPDNPIDSKKFAHRHDKNHPQSPGEVLWSSVLLEKLRPNEFHTFYYVRPNSLIGNRDLWEPVLSTVYQNFLQNMFADGTVPHFLFVPEPKCEWAYLIRYLRFKHDIKQYRDFEQSDNVPKHDPSQPAWLLRELRALNMIDIKHRIDVNFKEQLYIQQCLPNSMTVSFDDIQDNLDQVLLELSSRYPVVAFDLDRMAVWKDIYNEWRRPNDSLKWFNQLPDLVDDIIAGRPNLVYDCDEMQELLIESALMLKGYSIKSHGLLKFPKNLSLLDLEPLIHKIN
jgi:hypothetical protein